MMDVENNIERTDLKRWWRVTDPGLREIAPMCGGGEWYEDADTVTLDQLRKEKHGAEYIIEEIDGYGVLSRWGNWHVFRDVQSADEWASRARDIENSGGRARSNPPCIESSV